MTKLETALEFVKNGYGVIPLGHRSKSPAVKTWQPYREKLPTKRECELWLSSGWQNYGVVCGWNDLTVIDFDNMDVFNVWMEYFRIITKYNVVNVPFMVKTGRGAHVYITHPCIDRVNSKRVGIDIKQNGYVVGPGSTHPSGAEYIGMGVMQFPLVWDLETLLPSELFVPVVEVTPEVAPVIFEAKQTTEYDPFSVASTMPLNGVKTAQNGADLIKTIKDTVRLESLFPQAQKGTNGYLMACCPFHDDKSPSFWIDTKKQICGCHVCNMKPMDSINLYQRQHGISASEAVIGLAKEIGILA